jgi:hypothetical protein
LAQAEPGLDKLIGPIQWDIDGLDWSCYQQGTPIETCGDGYLNILRGRAQQNGILLLHDRPEFNVGSEGPLLLAQYMVPILKAEGYQFSTLDELLEHTPTGDMACPFDDGSAGAGGAGGNTNNGGAAGTAGAGGAAGSNVGGGGLGGSAGSVIAQPQAGAGGDAAMGGGGSAGDNGSTGALPPELPSAAGAPAISPTSNGVDQEASCAVPGHTSSTRSFSLSTLWFVTLGVALSRRRRSTQIPEQRRT